MWWKKRGLSAVVFITGAAILVVEVTATRILSPYYGNTIYMVSAVISIILGALSFGYWRGGIIADREPTERRFYKIIYQGGWSLFLLFLLMLTILPLGGHLFSLKSGPLIWALVLFFPSSYLLGMLSPFAITLAQKEHTDQGLGRTTGQIFFWSTTGSIAGSLGAGFILIPYFGVDSIIFGTTLTIVLLGGIGYFLTEKSKRKDSLFFLIILIIAIIGTFALTRNMTAENVHFVRDGVYERLSVVDLPYAGKPARFFLQDRSTSGVMYLEDDSLAADYTKYYALHKIFTPELSRALVIGGGIYSIPKALHNDRPLAQIDVAEIEPTLEHIAQTYFRLPKTTQITTHIADGRRLLYDTKEPYDMIFSDVYYSLYSIPAHFTTKEFFTEAKAKLSPNGIFVANIIGTTKKTPESLLFSEIRTIESVFPNMHVFAVNSTTSPAIQNFILVGINGTTTFEVARARAQIEDRGLFTEFSLRELPIDPKTLASYTILTDNYAPVEHLVSMLIEEMDDRGASQKRRFSGENALLRINTIVGFGSRAISTQGHEQLKEYIMKTLEEAQIAVTDDEWSEENMRFNNIIGRINPDATKRIILGTHYDSIAHAYRDKTNPNAVMPGANNGASGVALLLEAAEMINSQYATGTLGIDLVFFDGEEGMEALGAGSKRWYPIGSTHFAENLSTLYPKDLPLQAIIFDMVCDKDLLLMKEQISMESAKSAVDRFFNIGKKIAPSEFSNSIGKAIGDDHLPLAQKGIPSFLVIDYDYEPWYNTTNDTPDKCSAESLSIVGDTLLHYLQ